MSRTKKKPEEKYKRLAITLPQAALDNLDDLRTTAWGKIPASQVIARLISKAHFDREEE